MVTVGLSTPETQRSRIRICRDRRMALLSGDRSARGRRTWVGRMTCSKGSRDQICLLNGKEVVYGRSGNVDQVDVVECCWRSED